jgi:hypothetical protein
VGFVFIGSVFNAETIAVITKLARQAGIQDWAALNVKMVYRPEIFMAALKIFSMFPIFGIGQSEFYHQSANYDLTHAYFLSIEQNGENAHNYFLQTLAENGLVGFLLLVILVLYPIFKIQNKRLLIPALVGLGSIFVGNLYSHSMLVRENFFIAVGFLALMYAWVASEEFAPFGKPFWASQQSVGTSSKAYLSVAILGIVAVVMLGSNELRQATHRFPFTIDTQCYKSKPLGKDGWTSGLFEEKLPEGSTGITLQIKGLAPVTEQQPMQINISILNEQGDIVTQQDFSLNSPAPAMLSIDLPEEPSVLDHQYRMVLRTNRCFVPRNWGNNADDRRLGVQIESISSH